MLNGRPHQAFLLLCLSALTAFAGAPYDEALASYNTTDYASAIQQLRPLTDPRSLVLLGRAYLMNDEAHKAVEAFEKAVALDPSSSLAYDWLGRAYGQRASTAFPLAAIGLATHARDAFEKAVRLNPADNEAVNDLFEFYLEAPGIIGGGIDKARKLLPMIEKHDPAELHFAEARICEEQKDYACAETHYRKAMEMAPRQVGRIIDVAKFLAARGRADESDSVLQMADKIRPDSPRVMYARASCWIQEKRNLNQARDLLRRYIASTNLTPDDASRADANKLLKKASGN